MGQKEIIIRKVWRSEIKSVTMFLFLCFATVFLSQMLPFTVLRGDLIKLDSVAVYLKLPLFWLLPAFIYSTLLFRMYDVCYTMTQTGVEARSGIISLRTVLTRVRYEDILSIEVVQGLLDRLFDVGIIEISTAATGGVEILMDGVPHPRDIQNTLLAERDRRQQLARQEFEKTKSPAEIERNFG